MTPTAFIEITKKHSTLVANPRIHVDPLSKAEDQIALQIIEARHRLNLSQEDLAESVGVDQAVISRIENRKTIPSFNFLEKITKVLRTRMTITIS